MQAIGYGGGMRYALPIVFLTIQFYACAADAPVPRVLADFEHGMPVAIRAEGLTPSVVAEGAPQGKSALKLEPAAAGGAMRCFISLPENADPTASLALQASIKVESLDAAAPIVLRWFALDANGKPMFQHRLKSRDGEWQKYCEPLAHWAWARGRVGDWASVRSFVLTIEGRAKSIWLDEIELLHGEAMPKGALPTRAWLKELAFESRPNRAASEGDVWIATDLPDEISAEHLDALLKKVLAARTWLKNTFGPAFRTADPGRPISVLILSSKEAQVKLLNRLGEAWTMQVMPSNAGGYTVLDIATIPPAPPGKLSAAERPVYLHEAVHAMVGRDLRIVSGGELTNWFQEGIANFVQLCANPESLDRAVYVKNFARPIGAEGKTFFKPMKMLLTTPAKSEHYAQLASVVAFLTEKRREWLRAIATGLAEGEAAEKILPKIGTSFEALEKEWLEWGRAAFGNEKGEGIFAVPEEFKGISDR